MEPITTQELRDLLALPRQSLYRYKTKAEQKFSRTVGTKNDDDVLTYSREDLEMLADVMPIKHKKTIQDFLNPPVVDVALDEPGQLATSDTSKPVRAGVFQPPTIEDLLLGDETNLEVYEGEILEETEEHIDAGWEQLKKLNEEIIRRQARADADKVDNIYLNEFNKRRMENQVKRLKKGKKNLDDTPSSD